MLLFATAGCARRTAYGVRSVKARSPSQANDRTDQRGRQQRLTASHGHIHDRRWSGGWRAGTHQFVEFAAGGLELDRDVVHLCLGQYRRRLSACAEFRATGGRQRYADTRLRLADDAGEAKTGSASIAYTSTTDDNVAATVSPSGQIAATAYGGGASVSVTFATDDGNPATNLQVTTGLSSPPSGWSAPNSFGCPTISAGTPCQLTLNFAPQSSGSGTLTLNYSYYNDAGKAKTGTIDIPYLATSPHLYVTNLWTELDECDIGAGGVLGTCTKTPATGGPQFPSGIAFNGNTASEPSAAAT